MSAQYAAATIFAKDRSQVGLLGGFGTYDDAVADIPSDFPLHRIVTRAAWERGWPVPGAVNWRRGVAVSEFNPRVFQEVRS